MQEQAELQWVRGHTRWYIKTKCGRYNVSKTGPMTDIKYTAWRNDGKVILGTRVTADEAKALCDADRQR